MTNAKEQCVSCLLLVSPIKVLAGVAVDDTLEFLLQLCVVCKTVDRDAKEAAAQQVVQKGDALLYKSSVSFRRGLILVQAVIRTFIRRRVGKRRAIEISARSQTGRIPMSVGTRFLKELPHGRIYDGVIQAVRNNRYTLVYDQDPEAQDEVGGSDRANDTDNTHSLTSMDSCERVQMRSR
jgi:ribosomal protein S25